MFHEPRVSSFKAKFHTAEEIRPSADGRLLWVKRLPSEWGARRYWDSPQNGNWTLRNGSSVSGFCSSRTLCSVQKAAENESPEVEDW